MIKPISSVALHCDSDLAFNKAYSQRYNGKSRYITLRHSLVHDLIKGSVISVDYVNTKINMPDQFTKPLSRNSIELSAIGIGLWPSSTPWVKPNSTLEETSSLEFNVNWSLINCWEATFRWLLVALFVMLLEVVVPQIL